MADPLFDENTETLDAALNGKLQIIQPKKGYRFSIDALLLAYFAPSVGDKPVIDLGSGSGIIPLLLLKTGKASNIAGIEYQDKLASIAKRNIKLNNFEDSCKIINGDLRKSQDFFPSQKAKLVIANPPFFAVGSGRDNPDKQIRIARQEHKCTMVDVICAAKLLIKGTGKIDLIYPAERMFELFSVLQNAGLSAKRLRIVYGKQGEKARLILVEATINSPKNMLIEPPLTLENMNNSPTDEALRIMNGDWQVK